MERRELWYWISCFREIGWKNLNLLLGYFGDIDELFQADSKLITSLSCEKFSISLLEKLAGSRNEDKIHKSYEALQENDIGFVTKEEEAYPKRLLSLYDAPFFLYYKGELPEESIPSIAIIGARNCSNYGREIAVCFSKILAEHGIQIISGLARGIDGYAHEGALLGNGKTFGILGNGVDICYPRENIDLYMRMQDCGGLISEYPLKTPSLMMNFPIRNRIISGLSDGVFVIEAAQKSGTLITVDAALEQGKNIYVVPGRIGDTLSEGCIRLMKVGAKPVMEPSDILEDYVTHSRFNGNGLHLKKSKLPLETKEEIVYASLDLHPKHIENILQDTGLPINALAELLLSLELKNVVKQTNKNYYAITMDV